MTRITGGVSALLFACSTIGAASPPLHAQTVTAPKAVLVTGASSGIGRKIAERLAAHGFYVYAGARTKKDLDELSAITNVQGIRLDVTVPEDITAAVAIITQGGRGLYGVVNNAGVVGVAPLVEMSDKEFDFVFNVNLWGPIRVTRAFAPMLLESKGRVVNISSLNGIVASPMIGSYSIAAAQKVDIIKIRVDDNLGTTSKMVPDVYRAVIREAHARGLRVAVHLYYLDDARDLLASGADVIAHSVRDRPVDDAFTQAMRRGGACYTPTLMREVSTFVCESTPAFLSDSLFLTHANPQWVTAVQEPVPQQALRNSTSAQQYKRTFLSPSAI